MDFSDCKRSQMVKEAKIDRNLIHSLVQSSSKKFLSQKLLPLTQDTASSKVSLAYDSLRELLEALAISKGYKIYNHECFAAFLIEIMGQPNIASSFDKYRKARNAINYYGKDISPNEAKDLLQRIEETIEKIKQMHGKELA